MRTFHFFKRVQALSGKSAVRVTAFVATAIGLGITPLAHASEDKVAWLGGNYGISVPNENNTTSRSILGINGGAKVGSEYGVGAYYLTSHKDESVGGQTQAWNYDLYGIMAGYFFEGEARGVYVGAMLGMSKVGSGISPQTFSTSPMHWGVVAGYDYLLSNHFSLGGEVNYISVSNSSTTITSGASSVTASTDGFGMLNFLLAAKLWF